MEIKRTALQNKAHKILSNYLAKAGIELDGKNACDPQVHNPNLYNRIIMQGSLGLGEAYMDKWWDCEEIDELLCKVLSSQLDNEVRGKMVFVKNWLMPRLMNMQSRARSFQVGKQHYDAGNDLYKAMLDPTMSYSCGYWKDAKNLHEAQLAKLDLICRKLQLKAGEKVLEIGCGWGSFMHYASTKYKVEVTGITVSKEQEKLALERCKDLPVKVELMDYRSLQGKYNKIVSIGMFEHVGSKNYDEYFKSACRLMDDDGIFVLHTIGNDKTQLGTDPWINKYIFPNGQIPALAQIAPACEPYFVIEDVHNFGMDYDKTLMAWSENFEAAWPDLKDQYDERFYRMWNYYLKSCAGAFRSRGLQLFQIVLRKKLRPLPRYDSVR